MFVKQISVFLENTEGRLDEVLKILAQGGIDLVSTCSLQASQTQWNTAFSVSLQKIPTKLSRS